MGAALLGLALVLPAGVASAAPPDRWVTLKAKVALIGTVGVSASDVDVDTVDGIVTLHGTVASETERERAAAAVQRISGIRQMRNLLQVVPEHRFEAVAAADDRLKEQVSDALDADESLPDVHVQSVNAGVVLVAGEVDTITAHLQAIETASQVEGVRRVVSEIESPEVPGGPEGYAAAGVVRE